MVLKRDTFIFVLLTLLKGAEDRGAGVSYQCNVLLSLVWNMYDEQVEEEFHLHSCVSGRSCARTTCISAC